MSVNDTTKCYCGAVSQYRPWRGTVQQLKTSVCRVLAFQGPKINFKLKHWTFERLPKQFITTAISTATWTLICNSPRVIATNSMQTLVLPVQGSPPSPKLSLPRLRASSQCIARGRDIESWAEDCACTLKLHRVQFVFNGILLNVG